MRFLSATLYRSTNTADNRTRENSDTPYFKNTENNITMVIAYWQDRNMEITAVYLSQTSLNSENRFTASTNPFSSSLNRLFKEYAFSNLDLDACLKKGYCRLFSHCFNVRLDYNPEMELQIFLLYGVSPSMEI